MNIPIDTPSLIRLGGGVLAAFALAWAVYGAFGLIRFESGAAKQLRDFRNEGQQNTQQAALGDRLVRSLPISMSEWEAHLVWAQRGGYYKDQRIGNIVFTALLYAGAASLVVLFRPVPILFVFPLIAFAFPFIGVRSKANKVRRKAVRALPEMAALVAAELSAGSPADQAVLRAGDLPGPLSDLLSEAVSFSRQTGRPLFSRKPVQGALVEVFMRSGLPQLRAFAMQLDEVANKGIDAATLMNDAARSLSREYREQVMMEKELLGGTLTRHVAFHFFMPSVIVILMAFFIPMIELMSQ